MVKSTALAILIFVIISILNYSTLAINIKPTNDIKLSPGIYLYAFTNYVDTSTNQLCAKIIVYEAKSNKTISNVDINMPYGKIDAILSIDPISNNATLLCNETFGFTYLIEMDPFTGNYDVITDWVNQVKLSLIYAQQPYVFVNNQAFVPVELSTSSPKSSAPINIYSYTFGKNQDKLISTGLTNYGNSLPFAVYNNIDNGYYMIYTAQDGTSTVAKFNLTKTSNAPTLYTKVNNLNSSEIQLLVVDAKGEIMVVSKIGNNIQLCKLVFGIFGNGCLNVGTYPLNSNPNRFPFLPYMTSIDNCWFATLDTSSVSPSSLSFTMYLMGSTVPLFNIKLQIPNYWSLDSSVEQWTYFALNFIK